MFGLTAFYLSVSAAALVVAAFSHPRDRRHAVQIAAMLLMSCACYNSTLLSEAWWMWPPMDAVTCWFVAARCRIAPKRWQYVIMLALYAEILCHWRWQLGDKFGGSKYAYHLTLNMLFLGQLLAVSSSGIHRGWTGFCAFMVDRRSRGRRWRIALLHRAAHTERDEG